MAVHFSLLYDNYKRLFAFCSLAVLPLSAACGWKRNIILSRSHGHLEVLDFTPRSRFQAHQSVYALRMTAFTSLRRIIQFFKIVFMTFLLLRTVIKEIV